MITNDKEINKKKSSIITLALFILFNIVICIIFILFKKYFYFSEDWLVFIFFVIDALGLYFMLKVIHIYTFSEENRKAYKVLSNSIIARNKYKENSFEENQFIQTALVDKIEKNNIIFDKIISQTRDLLLYFNKQSYEVSGIQKETDIIEYLKLLEENICELLNKKNSKQDDFLLKIQKLINSLKINIEGIEKNLKNAIGKDEESKNQIIDIKIEVENIKQSLYELKNISKDIYISGQHISKISDETLTNTMQTCKIGEGLEKQIKQVTKTMEGTKYTIKDSTQMFDELTDSVNKIEMILSTITDISTQTDLLALNASIEAARAGEHGKGFAVVANNIKKLANKTSMSINQIEELIRDVQIKTEKVLNIVRLAVDTILQTCEEVNQTDSSFKTLLESISNVNKMLEQMLSLINKQANDYQYLTNNVNESSTLIKKSLVFIENVVENGKNNSDNMNKLLSEVNDFKVVFENIKETASNK